MATEPASRLSETPERLPSVAVFAEENKLVLSEETVAELQLQYGDYFAIDLEKDGRIVLTPIQDSTIATIQAKIATLGITEDDISDAVRWARGH